MGTGKTIDERPYDCVSPIKTNFTLNIKERKSVQKSVGMSSGVNTPQASSRQGSALSKRSDKERKSFQIKYT